MTAISYPDPSDEMWVGPASPGDEVSTLDLSMALASVREGVLMIFGPDSDPIPPQAVIASAAAHPAACLTYGAEARVPADRVAAVLEVQLRGPLAPGASEADAAAWIEGMLGLGEAPENEPDPWLLDEPAVGGTVDDRLARGAERDSPAGNPASTFGADPIEPWSPEPLALEIPEPGEIEPFDPFTFEPEDPEPDDPEVANFDLIEFESEPGERPDDAGNPRDCVTDDGEDGADEVGARFLPAIEERCETDRAGAEDDRGTDRQAAGAEDESGPGLAPADDAAAGGDQQPGPPDDGAESTRAAGQTAAASTGAVPLASDGAAGAAPVEEPPSEEPNGVPGLPDFVVLEPDGVLGLGCLAEAAERIEGPILYARIEGVPDGAILTTGRDEGGGNWGLTEADLARVSLVASQELGDFRLGLLLTSDAWGDLRAGLEVRAAHPKPPDDDAGSHERVAREVPLIFKPPLSPQNDLCRFALVQLGGVPASALLSAGAPDEAGTWLIAPGDLRGLTIRLPAGEDRPVELKAMAITVDERDGTIMTIEQDLTVVPTEGHAPDPPPSGAGRAGPRPIDLAPALERTGGDSNLTAVAITGLSGDARLSAGTFDDETGSWILRPGDLVDLQLEACDEKLLPMHLKITAIRLDPATGAPTAHATSMTIERPARPIDLPARHARPGGVGFFRPIARRRQVGAGS